MSQKPPEAPRDVAPGPPQSPLLAHVGARITAIRKNEQKELQLQLFPHWADDRRGVPNIVIRSSVFGVVRRGRRVRVNDLPIAAPEGWHLTVNGWRLDQSDLDVWLEVMHLARETKPGEIVRFTMYGMLKRLGLQGDGGDNRRWLQQRLKRLMQTTLSYDGPQHDGGPGNFITSFRIHKGTGQAMVRTNPDIRPLFESALLKHLDVKQRRSLGHNQLAKALHAMLSSHVDWLPMKVETLMRRVGADYAQVRFFRRDLKVVLGNFKDRGWIESWHFEGELLSIVLADAFMSPTQIRLIERRRNGKPGA